MKLPKFQTRRSQYCAAIFILILLLRWQVLQVVAWCWMLGSYSMAHGFSFAWRETFSGNYPCPLCHLVSNGQGAEAGLWLALAERPLLLAIPLAIVFTTSLTLLLPRLSHDRF